MQLTLQIVHVRGSESNQSATAGLFASPELKKHLDECTPRHSEIARGWQSTLSGPALVRFQMLVIFIFMSTRPQAELLRSLWKFFSCLPRFYSVSLNAQSGNTNSLWQLHFLMSSHPQSCNYPVPDWPRHHLI